MESRKGRLLGCTIVALPFAWLGSLLIVNNWMNSPSKVVLHSWEQPADIDYGSNGPYVLWALQGARDPTHEGLWNDTHRILLVLAPKSEGVPDHRRGFEWNPVYDRGSRSIVEFLSSSRPTWKPDGVWVDDGDAQIWFPKENFPRKQAPE